MSETKTALSTVKPASNRLSKILAWLLLFLLVGVGIFATRWLSNSLEIKARDTEAARLNEITQNASSQVEGSLRVIEESLASLRAFGTGYEPENFERLAQNTMMRNPAVTLLGYAPRLSAAALGTSPWRIGETTITEFDWLNQPVPVGNRAEYAPLVQIVVNSALKPEQKAPLSTLTGLDLLSTEEYSALFRSKEPVLVSYRGFSPGQALIVLPIDDIAGSRVAAVIAQIDLGILLSSSNVGSDLGAASVYDVSDSSGLRQLVPLASAPSELSEDPVLERLKQRAIQFDQFSVLGRVFRVEIEPLSRFFAVDEQLTDVKLAGYSGYGITALIALLLFNLITRNARIEKLVDQRGQELSLAYDQVRDSELMSMQNEKMSSLGQMVAGVAHEINTPLAFASSNIEMLSERLQQIDQAVEAQHMMLTVLPQWRTLSQEERNRWYQGALGQLNSLETLKRDILSDGSVLVDESMQGLTRVSELVSALKDFSRVDRVAVDDVDIHMCIENTLKIAHNIIKHKAEVVKHFGNLPHVTCNPSQINQVLLNLISNAAQAIPEFGRITIETATEPEGIVVHVTDTGTGISKENIGKIFDPFFTTKASGQGTGLGLAICSKIIKAHGGRLEVNSPPGAGATFSIHLPFAAPNAA